MAFEHFKTQVLLLHSEQSTLDKFSAGFNDKFSVHCATSGTEALNTLGDTPIHVIVSAQDLPGMSGLDAIREARKRSPDTIGILLAGSDKEDGLEALVGDQEVFQIVRGSVTAEALLKLIESATQRVRLLALAESANDQAAHPDEPVTEHIVMETSEHGSSIISDGTGRLPALQPHKIEIAPDEDSRSVDVVLMTRDEEFLTTIKESARGLHNVHHAVTPKQAEDFVRDKKVGVLVTDAAMVGSTVEALTQKLRSEKSRIVAIIAGRRDDGEMLMDLINRGHIYRFLLKPVSPGRARLAIEASVRHHLEAPDSAFKPKSPSASTRPRPAAKSKPMPKPKSIAKPKPVAKKKPIEKLKPAAKKKPIEKPKPVAKSKPAAKKKTAAKKEPKLAPLPEPIPVLMPKIKAKAKPRPAPRPKSKKNEKVPDRIEPTISASSIDDVLDVAFDDKTSLTDTVTGIAESVGKTLASAGSLAGGAQSAVQASSKAAADAIGSALAPTRNPQTLRIAGGSIAVIAVVAWVFSSWESTPADVASGQADAVPTVADSGGTFAPPVREAEVEPVPQPLPEIPAYQALLDDARAARDAGNLIEPAGDNAVELYLMVLEETQEDPLISAELDDVVSQVLGLAETAILEQSAGDAINALSIVLLADPDNPRLTFLDAQLTQLQLRMTMEEARIAIRDGFFEDAGRLISEARSVAGLESAEVNLLSEELSAARNQQRIEKVLTTANERLESGNLLAPENDNARYYYELVLSEDTGNQTAQQGLMIVASKLVLQAREAIDNGRLADAAVLLRDARALDLSSAELAASTKALDAEFEAIAEAKRQAEAARLAELERQAEHQREAERQAKAARLAELEQQAELERQAEAARREELRKQAELEQEAELERLAELDRQAEAARLAEIERIADERRQEIAREAQQQASENDAAAAATKSVLGVAGSKVIVASSDSTAGSSNRQAVQSNNVPAPPIETPPAASPRSTVQASRPQIDSTASSVVDSFSNWNSTEVAADNTVPISTLTRTNYIAPKYPRAAQRRNVTGSVDVMFTVSTDGTVTDISVVRAEPEKIFNEAAMDAVAQWRFQPVIENGLAVEKQTAIRLGFDLH